MLAVAAFFVAAIGRDLARLPWLDPPFVSPAHLPRWDLLCFQHVLRVVVGAALLAAVPAAMIVFLVCCLFLLFLIVKVFRSEE